MDFRVLGHLTVTIPGGEIDVGGSRQRRLLAALIINANEVVSTDRLIDIVFEGRPPKGAATTIRSYVARLRKSLKDAQNGDHLILTETPGYVLRIDPEAIDGERFVAAIESGRRQLADQDAVGAVASLRDAMAMWSGPAYGEFAYEDWARVEALRLEELRAVAEETLTEAQLACGLAEEVIPQLRRLIEIHPLRDRLRAHLMLALYRAGRQAEALRSFEDYREELIEVGLEPSAELQALERSIAVHDPALHLAAPAGRPLRGYRLGAALGRGRHGVVYWAVQPGVGREVAIKVIRPELADDPAFIRRFDAEAQLVSRLEHPHIVPLYDFWREPGGAFLVMRLLSGDLSQRLTAGPMDAPGVAKLAQQLGSALSTAHRAGVVHGDVKPSNVLIDDEANAYLADFGVATLAGEPDTPDPSLSSGHESPEQLSGEPASPASDQFALAVLLVQALTGVLPFGRRAIASPHDRVPSIHVRRPSVAAAVDQVVWKATAWDPQDRFADVAGFVSDLTAALGGRPPTAAAAGAVTNPYRGLRPFTETDWEQFFGRDAVVEELLGRVGRDDAGGRLVTLVGASGSGKSSIVRAGLVPRLRDGPATGTGHWFIATMTPGSDPFAELEAALRSIAVTGPSTDRPERESDEHLVGRILRDAVPDGPPVLLVIDQLEELFTVVSDEPVRRAFLGGVARAVSDPDANLWVVATLRADFYDRPLRYHHFGRLIKNGAVTVVGMSAAELGEAIRGPAALVGVEVEPALVTEIVADAVDQPAALPMVQYTLTELFERRSGRVMTHDSYRDLGGVDAAVAGRADRVYEQVPQADRDRVQRVFLRLVSVTDVDTATRHRVLRSELTSLSANPNDVDRIIDLFGEARLLTFDRDPSSRAPTVEIAHEALTTHWPLLSTWVAEAGEGLRIQAHLTDAASAWDRQGRDQGDLYRGARLEVAADWVDGHPDTVNPLERAFLDRSLETHESEQAAEREHLELQQRSNRRLRILLTGAGLALVVALIAGFLAVDQRNTARDETARADAEARVATVRELAVASAAALDNDPELSILLAIEAIRASGDDVLPEAEEALHRAVLGTRQLASVANGGEGIAHFSPDGTSFITLGEDPSLARVWSVNPVRSQLTLIGHDDAVLDAVFSPDGSLIATTGLDGTVRVWDAQTGAAETVLTADFPVIPAFSSDGSALAATTFSGTTVLWDLATETIVWTLEPPPPVDFALNLAFSPDDSMLAVAQRSDSELVGPALWDLDTGQLIGTLDGHDASVTDLAFSPDGTQLYTSSFDSTVKVWDVTTGENTGTFFGHEASVIDLHVAATGDRVASSGLVDVLVWDPATFEIEAEIVGHSAAVDGIDITADGSLLVTASGIDGTTRLWDLTPYWSHELVTLPGPDFLIGVTHPAGSVAFSPDGDILAAAGGDGFVNLWDLPEGNKIGSVSGPGEATFSLAFTPDGRLLAAAGLDGVTLHDARTGQELAQPIDDLETNNVAVHPDGSRFVTAGDGAKRLSSSSGEATNLVVDGWAYDAAFTPDGTMLAVSHDGGRDDQSFFVEIFDEQSNEVIATLSTGSETDAPVHSGPVLGLAFSPDGGLLATAGEDAITVIWDLATFEPVVRLEGHSGAITNVAFDPSKDEVATAGADSTIKIWDATTGARRLTLPGQEPFSDLAYSPDGRYLAASSPFGLVTVHILDIDELLDEADRRLTRRLTQTECVQYLHTTDCP